MDRVKHIVAVIDDHPSLFSPEIQTQEIESAFATGPTSQIDQLMLKFDGISDVRQLFTVLHERRATHFVCFRLMALKSFFSSFLDLSQFISDLKDHNIEFVSIKESINTEDELGVFLRNLTTGWKAARLMYKSENPKVSQMKAKEKGVPLGRPKKRDDERVAVLRKQGLSIRDIAAKTGVSTAAVQRALKVIGAH